MFSGRFRWWRFLWDLIIWRIDTLLGCVKLWRIVPLPTLLEFYGRERPFDMWLLLGNHAHVKTCMLSRNGAVVTTIFQESKRLLIDLTIGRGFSFLLFFYRWSGNKRMEGFLMVQIWWMGQDFAMNIPSERGLMIPLKSIIYFLFILSQNLPCLSQPT